MAREGAPSPAPPEVSGSPMFRENPSTTAVVRTGPSARMPLERESNLTNDEEVNRLIQRARDCSWLTDEHRYERYGDPNWIDRHVGWLSTANAKMMEESVSAGGQVTIEHNAGTEMRQRRNRVLGRLGVSAGVAVPLSILTGGIGATVLLPLAASTIARAGMEAYRMYSGRERELMEKILLGQASMKQKACILADRILPLSSAPTISNQPPPQATPEQINAWSEHVRQERITLQKWHEVRNQAILDLSNFMNAGEQNPIEFIEDAQTHRRFVQTERFGPNQPAPQPGEPTQGGQTGPVLVHGTESYQPSQGAPGEKLADLKKELNDLRARYDKIENLLAIGSSLMTGAAGGAIDFIQGKAAHAADIISNLEHGGREYLKIHGTGHFVHFVDNLQMISHGVTHSITTMFQNLVYDFNSHAEAASHFAAQLASKSPAEAARFLHESLGSIMGAIGEKAAGMAAVNVARQGVIALIGVIGTSMGFARGDRGRHDREETERDQLHENQLNAQKRYEDIVKEKDKTKPTTMEGLEQLAGQLNKEMPAANQRWRRESTMQVPVVMVDQNGNPLTDPNTGQYLYQHQNGQTVYQTVPCFEHLQVIEVGKDKHEGSVKVRVFQDGLPFREIKYVPIEEVLRTYIQIEIDDQAAGQAGSTTARSAVGAGPAGGGGGGGGGYPVAVPGVGGPGPSIGHTAPTTGPTAPGATSPVPETTPPGPTPPGPRVLTPEQQQLEQEKAEMNEKLREGQLFKMYFDTSFLQLPSEAPGTTRNIAMHEYLSVEKIEGDNITFTYRDLNRSYTDQDSGGADTTFTLPRDVALSMLTAGRAEAIDFSRLPGYSKDNLPMDYWGPYKQAVDRENTEAVDRMLDGKYMDRVRDELNKEMVRWPEARAERGYVVYGTDNESPTDFYQTIQTIYQYQHNNATIADGTVKVVIEISADDYADPDRRRDIQERYLQALTKQEYLHETPDSVSKIEPGEAQEFVKLWKPIAGNIVLVPRHNDIDWEEVTERTAETMAIRRPGSKYVRFVKVNHEVEDDGTAVTPPKPDVPLPGSVGEKGELTDEEKEKVANLRIEIERLLISNQLEPKEAYEQSIARMTEVLRSESGIIDLERKDVPTIVLSDLHARKNFIGDVLLGNYQGEPVLDLLAQGRLNIVCVGDGLHSEKGRNWTIGRFNGEPGWEEFTRLKLAYETKHAELMREYQARGEDEDTARAHTREDARIRPFKDAYQPEYSRAYRQMLDEEMAAGLGTMKIVMETKSAFPASFHFIRGNHDDVKGDFEKFGDESKLVSWWMEQFGGGEFLDEYTDFEDQLPYIVKSDRFMVCHAAPGGHGSQSLDEWRTNFPSVQQIADKEHDVLHSLTWTENRPGEITPEREAEIEKNLRNLKSQLGLPDDARVIIGHRDSGVGDNLYRSQFNGELVQINNPNKMVIAIIPYNRPFDPDHDVIELTGPLNIGPDFGAPPGTPHSPKPPENTSRQDGLTKDKVEEELKETINTNEIDERLTPAMEKIGNYITLAMRRLLAINPLESWSGLSDEEKARRLLSDKKSDPYLLAGIAIDQKEDNDSAIGIAQNNELLNLTADRPTMGAPAEEWDSWLKKIEDAVKEKLVHPVVAPEAPEAPRTLTADDQEAARHEPTEEELRRQIAESGLMPPQARENVLRQFQDVNNPTPPAELP